MDQTISLINKIKKLGLTLSLAESCTGGKVASTIVSHEGVSEFFLGGVVTYSIDSKISILNIDKNKIEKYGVVSDEIAKDMATAVKELFQSDISVAVTGNVGLTSGDGISSKGQVFIAVNLKNKNNVWEFNFNNDRKTNIDSVVSKVLSLLDNIL